ncbi:MAG: DNA polymerase III subunit gamma/tau [Candidatus Aminicenantes bacterium]|nr:MAG: DNA polymerase III subunit gamma/tau [Candidatus Aminicenantes bacterium]
MTYLVYARKYRPKAFEEMIGQKPVVQTLQNAIKNDRVAHAYIFSGMRGVGKTTAARILAKALNCQYGPTPTPCNKCEFCTGITDDRSVDVLEIDGASNRGIDEVRSLREGVKYKPIHSRYKVIIIDEVHMLTRDAFNALLKTLEEPPGHTVFIFATTEFHKVPATIASRCQHFEFKKISQKEVINHLLDITQKENIEISSYGLNLIAEAADGSLRDAQSLLDKAVAFSGEVINDEDLKEILGTINKEILFESSRVILEEKQDQVFPLIEKIIDSGYDLRFFYNELIKHFRNLLLVKSVERPQELVVLNEEDINRLKESVEEISSEEVLRYLIALQQGEQGLKFSSHPRIYLEALLVKLCQFKKIIPVKDIIQELEDIKKEIKVPSKNKENFEVSTSNQNRSVEKTVSSPEVLPPPETRKAGARNKNEVFAGLLEALQKEKGHLAAILDQRSSFKFKDAAEELKTSRRKGDKAPDSATLEVFFSGGNKFYVDTVKKEKKLLEKVASEVIGHKVSIKISEEIVEVGGKKEREVETALKDPSVQHFMDTFKAQILSVEPITRTKDKE